jgi:hypothetical protein
MSKRTVSAAGGAMPAEGHETRRALLRFFGAAPALAALPATAMLTAPRGDDAELFAMQSAIEAADMEFNTALDVLEAAEDAYSDKEPDAPAKPDAAVFSAEEQRAVDAMAAVMRERKTPLPAWAAHNQAVQDYERECERMKAECGVTAAHELEDATAARINQVRAVLVETPAKTLAGLIFKARYAATHYSDDYDDEVMTSIVDDLLALADDPEGLADV